MGLPLLPARPSRPKRATESPLSFHSCRRPQPHPYWPGEGSQLRPAEDRRAIFSRNKRREIAPTGEQPLFQANFHIIESNDFLSFLPAPLHNLKNCERDLIQGLNRRGWLFRTNGRGGGVEKEEGPPKVPAASALGREPHRRSPRLLRELPPGRQSLCGAGWPGLTFHHRFSWQAEAHLRSAGRCLELNVSCRACQGAWLRAGPGADAAAPGQDSGCCLCCRPRGGKALGPPAKAAGAPVPT